MNNIDIRMSRARAQLVQDHAFFGSLVMRLIVVERDDISTLATDAKFLFYNKAFLDRIPEPELLFCVAHETLHCALSHMTRRGDRRWDLWQAATDYVVNWMLSTIFTAPKWLKYFDRRFAGLSVEAVYAILENEEKKGAATKPKAGQPSATSGNTKSEYAPAYGDPGGTGEVLDAAPPHNKAALDEVAEEWKVYTRQATNIAKRQGNVPGFIEELVEVLNDPQADWREVLRQFVDPSATKDYSWSNPNRRLMALGYFSPGVVSDGVSHAVMAVDSSASVNNHWLSRCGTEVQAALDEGAIDKLTVIFADTQVNKAIEYTRGDIIDFSVVGRGGTAFSPTFEWINYNAPDVTAMIYFTDLECDNFGDLPSYPVLWAVHGEDPREVRKLMDKVPFGTCLELRN